MMINTPDLSYKISKGRTIIGKIFSSVVPFFSEIFVFSDIEGNIRFNFHYSITRISLTREFVKRV